MPNSKRKRQRRRRQRKTQQNQGGRVVQAQPGFVERMPPKEELLGARIGREIGTWAHGALKSLFGTGDYAEEFQKNGSYNVTENSIVKPEMALASPMTAAPAVPLINDISDGQIRIRHREYIRDFSASDVPVTAMYRLNPTENGTFPYLSGIAKQFEQWKPNGIVFEFVSTCGNAVSSTNAALGSVSIATQYNSLETGFSSKTQLLNHYFACSGKTSDNLMHAIECAPAEIPTNLLWTDVDTPYGAAEDDRLTDLGYTFVWREGSQAVYTAGELWVTYDITLLKPRLPSTALDTLNCQQLAEWLKKRGKSADYDPRDVPPPPKKEPVRDKDGNEIVREYVDIEPLIQKLPRIPGGKHRFGAGC